MGESDPHPMLRAIREGYGAVFTAPATRVAVTVWLLVTTVTHVLFGVSLAATVCVLLLLVLAPLFMVGLQERSARRVSDWFARWLGRTGALLTVYATSAAVLVVLADRPVNPLAIAHAALGLLSVSAMTFFVLSLAPSSPRVAVTTVMVTEVAVGVVFFDGGRFEGIRQPLSIPLSAVWPLLSGEFGHVFPRLLLPALWCLAWLGGSWWLHDRSRRRATVGVTMAAVCLLPLAASVARAGGPTVAREPVPSATAAGSEDAGSSRLVAGCSGQWSLLEREQLGPGSPVVLAIAEECGKTGAIWASAPGRGFARLSIDVDADTATAALTPSSTLVLLPVDADSGAVLTVADLALIWTPPEPRSSVLPPVAFEVPMMVLDLEPAQPDPARPMIVRRLAPGVYDLELHPPGYAPLEIRGLRVDPSANLDLGAVELRRSGSVCGRVHGRGTGERAGIRWTSRARSGSTRLTDGSDLFCLSDLPAGERIGLSAVVEAREGPRVEVDIPSNGVVLTVPPPNVVRIEVVDSEGVPAPRFRVRVVLVTGSGRPLQFGEGRFDVAGADGRARAVLPPIADLALEVTAPGCMPELVRPPFGDEILVTLVGLGELRGTVVDATDLHGIEAARLEMHATDRDLLEPLATASSDPNGDFVLSAPVGDQPCQLFVRAEGYARRALLREPCFEESGVEIEIKRVPPLHVAVSGPEGEPVEGARVRLDSLDTPLHWDAATNARGSAELTEVPEGQWMVVVEHADFRRAQLVADLGGSQARHLEVSLHRGTHWTGRVIGLPRDGQGAQVILQAGSETVRSVTGYRGYFDLSGGPSGRVTWHVVGGGLQRPCSGDMSVPEGVPVWDADLYCETGVVDLAGRISNSDGPLAGANLLLRPANGEGRLDTTAADQHGAFGFTEVVPGAYDLIWLSSGGVITVWSGYVTSDELLELTVPGN